MGCNKHDLKSNLIKIVQFVHDDEKLIKIDKKQKINGRGAYICYNTRCLRNVRKSRRINKAFSKKVEDEVFDEIENLITSQNML